MLARKIIHHDNHTEFLGDPQKLAEMRENIKAGDVYIFRGVVPKEKLLRVREYLTQIGRNSLPNYKKIEVGCPNFHRINIWDNRAYVAACFHQFVFFPWNQDIFNLFELTREVFYMRNLISGLPKDKFMGSQPMDGCTSRIAFQFYPKGLGGMNKHQDPYDHHQLTVPTLTLSKKGQDFKTGGAYVDDTGGQRVYLDDVSDIGDVSYFNSQTPHGVEVIDEGAEQDWASFEGRWMMLAAVNKLADNQAISNAVDLEKK